MTRVASFSQSQSLMQGILRNQANLFEAQKQVNTGKKSEDFAGISSQVSTLVGAKSLRARTETYINATQTVSRTLSTYDLQLGAIHDSAAEIRQNIIEALGQDQSQGFEALASNSFNLVVSALNTKIGGAFIFSGSQTDIPPVTVQNFTDLAGIATAADAFQNDQLKATARTADNVMTEYGLLANEVGEELVASFKRMADFNAGPDGPISGPLTTAQRAFLESELVGLDAAIAQTQSLQVTNGLRANEIESITAQHQDQSNFLEVFISDIEDVNIAEAISRLNNDQIALEASYRVVGRIAQLSLADFI